MKQRNIGHMPFEGHRTQAQVRQDEELGKGLRRLSALSKRRAA